jgi:hypothetical protein
MRCGGMARIRQECQDQESQTRSSTGLVRDRLEAFADRYASSLDSKAFFLSAQGRLREAGAARDEAASIRTDEQMGCSNSKPPRP